MIDIYLYKFDEHDWLGVGFYDVGKLIKLECDKLGIDIEVNAIKDFHKITFKCEDDWHLFKLTRKLVMQDMNKISVTNEKTNKRHPVYRYVV